MIARMSSCFLLALVACGASWGDVLDEIAPAAVVCIGKDAPDEEREAANLICQALRGRSESVRLLTDEEVLGKPPAESGRWHVIAVGRATTNKVLLTYPSYWALDRELHYAPLGNMPAAPFTETRGFYVGGFGYFFPGRDVGFVEFDRSPLYAEMILSLRAEKEISAEDAPPLRFLIRITGSTPNGVLLGAKRFVETRMLYGVAIGPPRWPRSHDLWNLDDENIKPDVPAWVPKGEYGFSGRGSSDEAAVSFLGWLMVDRMMYAGFLELIGCQPVQMWRAKYRTQAGLNEFNRSPHHRASGNELLIVKLSSSDEATKALEKLGGTAPVNIAGCTWYKSNGAPGGKKTGKAAIGEEGTRSFQMEGSSAARILPATIGDETYLILANFDERCVEMITREVGRSLAGKE